MTVFDRLLAGVGRLVASIGRRARWAPWALVIGLLTTSLIPALIVGATPQPADISFEDLKAGRIPAMTSWLRMEGDLRAHLDDSQYIYTSAYTYTLHDPQDDRRSVTVVSESPLATGHMQVSGRISGAYSVAGSVATIAADVPTEPARHDPWAVLGLLVILAVLVLIGMRVGYPVIRHERPSRSRPVPLGPDESLAARWSGWIGNDSVPLDAMRPCTIAVAADVEVCRLTVTDALSSRTVSTRRGSPKRRVRICRTDGCQPALEIHAPSADLVLAFDDGADRDRLATSLGSTRDPALTRVAH